MSNKKSDNQSSLHQVPGVAGQENLNPDLSRFHKLPDKPDTRDLIKNVQLGDRAALSRAITYVESTVPLHQDIADEIVTACMPHSGKSIRMGITGVPGVGKSSFIERFGLNWIERGHKVAVLAIDPSSSRTGGSILGDKTRMNELARHDMAYIRPSPSSGSLGGVARKTREAILLCEAAGYDIIIVETMGVGQSEITVKRMVDAFVLLLLPGAGDELQGMKRGIMEMADLILVNKADSGQERKAELAVGEVQRALKLYPEDERGWTIPVRTCSALEGMGIEAVLDEIAKYADHMKIKGLWDSARKEQAAGWYTDTVRDLMADNWLSQPQWKARYEQMLDQVREGRISPVAAARKLFEGGD